MDWGNNLIDEAGDIGQAVFAWMGQRDQAKYGARTAEAWAAAYAQAAPSIAQAQAAGAVSVSAQQSRLMLAGFAILAVVVLFRIRPTANG
jgi:hypothetical protein